MGGSPLTLFGDEQTDPSKHRFHPLTTPNSTLDEQSSLPTDRRLVPAPLPLYRTHSVQTGRDMRSSLSLVYATPKRRSRYSPTERTAADRLLSVHTGDSMPRVVENNPFRRLIGWPPPTLGLRPCSPAPVAANTSLCRHPHRILVDFSAVRWSFLLTNRQTALPDTRFWVVSGNILLCDSGVWCCRPEICRLRSSPAILDVQDKSGLMLGCPVGRLE